jgi:DNA-binding response OmpR family regulator
MAKILIVEDDKDIALGLEEDLTRHGFQVETVGDGEKALSRSKECHWDLILLDLMLPRKDGTHEAEKIFGLEIGADDYITKPFSPRELRARIHAVLRRTSGESPETYQFDDYEVDFDRGEVRRSGRPIDLSALEFRLLTAFVRRRGRVLSREQLIDAAWGPATIVTERVVDTHILNLRKKIEPVPAKPRYICSVRGMGYRFEG